MSSAAPKASNPAAASAKGKAAGPASEPFGFMENGLQAFGSYRPSQKCLADALVRARAVERPYVDLVPAA